MLSRFRWTDSVHATALVGCKIWSPLADDFGNPRSGDCLVAGPL